MNANGQPAPNRLKRNLAAGKVCLGATITINNPAVAEIMSHIGLDWLWFETEHSSLTLDNVLTMLHMIKRALDLGPDGIIVPLVNTSEEAEAAVRAMKYPPWGERGGGLGRAQCYGLHMGEYMETANDEVMLIPMIEHIQAVENIDEILKVKGVDSVMVGGLDLSGSMGILGQTGHPKVEGAIQKVLASCKKAKVPCGIITVAPEQASERIKHGFTNIIMGIDVLFLHSAALGAMAQIVKG